MKLRILSFITLTLSSVHAMDQAPALPTPTETPLHRAAKAGNYAACFGIIKDASLVDIQQAVPKEHLKDFNDMIDVYDSTKSPKSQSQEFKEIQKRMPEQLKHPLAFITLLCTQQVEQVRALKDQHGHIPLDYVPQTASAALRALLTPKHTASMLNATDQALNPIPGDTPLHSAAKIGSYRNCFDILTDSLQKEISAITFFSTEQLDQVKKTYQPGKSFADQTEEYKAAITAITNITVKNSVIEKRMSILNAHQLRSAQNAAGLTPVACLPTSASDELRTLLDPNNSDLFTSENALTVAVEKISIYGYEFPCAKFLINK